MRLIFRNIGWKLLALAIALVVWITVASEPELSSFATVPVMFRNLPDELDINSEPVESVSLEIRGPAGELRDFSGSGAAVVLDMAQVRTGERTFSIGDGSVRLPRGVRLVRSIPAQLRFDFEQKISRQVPVQVRFSKPPQPGYEIAAYQASPPAATIVGPETRVRRVQSVDTDAIDVSSVVGDAQFQVNTFVNDPRVRFVTPPQASVHVVVKRK